MIIIFDLMIFVCGVIYGIPIFKLLKDRKILKRILCGLYISFLYIILIDFYPDKELSKRL